MSSADKPLSAEELERIRKSLVGVQHNCVLAHYHDADCVTVVTLLDEIIRLREEAVLDDRLIVDLRSSLTRLKAEVERLTRDLYPLEYREAIEENLRLRAELAERDAETDECMVETCARSRLPDEAFVCTDCYAAATQRLAEREREVAMLTKERDDAREHGAQARIREKETEDRRVSAVDKLAKREMRERELGPCGKHLRRFTAENGPDSQCVVCMLAEREREREEARTSNAVLVGDVYDLKAELAERERELARRSGSLREANEEIARLVRLTDERKRERDEARAQLAKREREVEDFKGIRGLLTRSLCCAVGVPWTPDLRLDAPFGMAVAHTEALASRDALLAELVGALEPFAKIETPEVADDAQWVATTIFCNDQVTAYSVRKARAALSRAQRAGVP